MFCCSKLLQWSILLVGGVYHIVEIASLLRQNEIYAAFRPVPSGLDLASVLLTLELPQFVAATILQTSQCFTTL